MNNFRIYVYEKFNVKLPTSSIFKDFRFPEYKNSEYKGILFLVEIILGKDKIECYKKLVKSKSLKHKEKIKNTNLKKGGKKIVKN